ncbi:SRPBCC family protein [Lentzea sp. NPDC059081]|uniref:SRPBCC family protein n=1 Tax=Lentzea sp. NPDC059081 TaxID=3346719 RepID=UPI0036BFEF00
MNLSSTFLRCAGIAALSTAATLATLPVAAADNARPDTRGHEVCRHVTVDKTAPVISKASVLVKAPVSTIWRLHTDIDAWSAWIPEITPASKTTPGPLRPGSTFTWSPQNMKVTSTVTAVSPRVCTAWAAPVNGINGIHLFTFKPVRGGVLVTTEESWAGAPVEADVPGNQASLDAGLRDWVNRIKDTAEARTNCPRPVPAQTD